MRGKSPIVDAVRKQDLERLKRALAKPAAIPAQAVVDAGRLAWKPGLALLVKHGADLNGLYRNYRALHALIQEKPHEGGSSTPKRIACLRWLLEHGADPELPAAWPSARAIVIAAFVGEPGYVDAVKEGGARIDVFAASALGDATKVGKLLAKDPALASARDGGLLTALHCCAGSRLGAKSPKIAKSLVEIARMLVEAGADPNAKVKSWGHDVDVSYFVIRSGQARMLELLLAKGLDATAAIAAAAWDAREDLLDMLLAHGARIDEAFDHTKPVLNEQVRWGQFRQARLMLRKGASPNLPDERGWTAVHQAVSRGSAKMLADLIEAGGDAHRRDRSGVSPKDMARAAGRADLLRLLR